MFKLLLTAGIIYFIYRFFIQNNALKEADQQPPLDHSGQEDDEFIDYEEVE